MSAPPDAPTSLVANESPAPARLAEKVRLERSLTRLRSLALLMDDRFELPIVRVRFGLDPLIGLVPGWGDWISWSISAYIIVEAVRLGVPLSKLLTMAFHAALDLITGYLPGIGDLIDVVYKANRRNVNVVLSHFGADPISFSKDKDAAAADVDAVVVPDTALDLPQRSGAARWLAASGLILVLAALAALPALLLWWYWSRG